MSLNELILDQPKPWLNIRVNSITVDSAVNAPSSTYFSSNFATVTSTPGVFPIDFGTVKSDGTSGAVSRTGNEYQTTGKFLVEAIILLRQCSTANASFVMESNAVSLSQVLAQNLPPATVVDKQYTLKGVVDSANLKVSVLSAGVVELRGVDITFTQL